MFFRGSGYLCCLFLSLKYFNFKKITPVTVSLWFKRMRIFCFVLFSETNRVQPTFFFFSFSFWDWMTILHSLRLRVDAILDPYLQLPLCISSHSLTRTRTHPLTHFAHTHTSAHINKHSRSLSHSVSLSLSLSLKTLSNLCLLSHSRSPLTCAKISKTVSSNQEMSLRHHYPFIH